MAVYFIRAGESGPVKIGHAIDPQARLAALQTGHFQRLEIIRICEGDRRLEFWFHDAFSDQRIAGEWFRFTPEMLSLCAPQRAADFQTFRDVIELWAKRIDFARAVNVSPVRASAWWQRDSIPPEWWTEVVTAAHRAGHMSVTVDLLATIAAGKRKEAA